MEPAGPGFSQAMGNWQRAAASIVREASNTVDRGRMRRLHRKSGWGHAGMAAIWLGLGAAGAALAWQGSHPWLWPVGIALLGLFALDGTVMLHEVLHGLVVSPRNPGLERLLGLLYALPCGISPSQFTRWHLDHHRELGTGDRDPKRRHLSPKRNSRLLKLAYWTPALFPIYFRAAARESATYPEGLRRRIARERAAGIAFHLMLAAVLVLSAGWGVWLRVHLLPLLLAFPFWFALNRLGQHYAIDPEDPAHWGTLMKRSPFWWDILFLWSNYHLEHHYFPAVPAYRLPALRCELEPFFHRRGIRARGYAELVWGWLVRNQPPHARWSV